MEERCEEWSAGNFDEFDNFNVYALRRNVNKYAYIEGFRENMVGGVCVQCCPQRSLLYPSRVSKS